MTTDTYTMGLPDAPVRCYYCGEVIGDRRQRCPELPRGVRVRTMTGGADRLRTLGCRRTQGIATPGFIYNPDLRAEQDTHGSTRTQGPQEGRGLSTPRSLTSFCVVHRHKRCSNSSSAVCRVPFAGRSAAATTQMLNHDTTDQSSKRSLDSSDMKLSCGVQGVHAAKTTSVDTFLAGSGSLAPVFWGCPRCPRCLCIYRGRGRVHTRTPDARWLPNQRGQRGHPPNPTGSPHRDRRKGVHAGRMDSVDTVDSGGVKL